MSSVERSSGWLPGLIFLALSVLMWWAAQGWQEERAGQVSQAETTKRLLSRRDSASAESLRKQREVLTERRQALARRLAGGNSIEIARAELFYDVRQRCYEIKLTCTIRLSDATAAAAVKTSAGSGGGNADKSADPLSALGVQRVRAIVTGNLTTQDLVEVTEVFRRDPERQWRINRMQAKGRAFELDLERHFMTTGS